MLLDLISFFSASRCLVLFEVIRLLKLVSLLSNSVLVTKLTCFNLAAKFSDVILLNSGVVINLSLLWSEIFFSVSLTLCYSHFFD